MIYEAITEENDNVPPNCRLCLFILIRFYFLLKGREINVLKDLHSLAKCSLASTGLLCEPWNSTLGIRHSQFAYTIDGSILWSAGVSRGGAECLFFSFFASRTLWRMEQASTSDFLFFFSLSLSPLFSVFLCCLEAPGITQARQAVSVHWQRPKRGKHRNCSLRLCNHTKLLLLRHFFFRGNRKVQNV